MCPAWGHICAISRHFPCSSIYKRITQKTFTLHLFARNADKHRGFETEKQILTLHHPSSWYKRGAAYILPFSDFDRQLGAWFRLLLWIVRVVYYAPVKSSMMLALRPKSHSDKPSSIPRNACFLSLYDSSVLNDARYKRGAAYPMRMKGDEGWICAFQPLKPR